MWTWPMVALKVKPHKLRAATIISPVYITVLDAGWRRPCGAVVVGNPHAVRRLVQHVDMDEEARIAGSTGLLL